MTDNETLIGELKAIVGDMYVVHTREDLIVFEYDGSVDKALPQAVVLPGSAEEVAEVVKIAASHQVPIIPRGAGTGLSGGAIAETGGIVVALTRLTRILEVDVENRVAVVEPGLVNLELTTAVSRHGLYYAPDPSSQKACTIGGNVAENSGGPHCLAYGVTTNHVLGMEVVLADGSIQWVGGKTRETPGYDLRGILIGSEGTLAIVTKVAVRLLRQPEAVKTLLAVFRELDHASAAVSGIIGAGIVPAAIEMMDDLCLRAAEASVHAGYPADAGAVLLVEVDGLRESVEEETREIERVCRMFNPMEIRTATDAADRERLWAGRKGVLGALGRLAPNYYLVDGTVLAHQAGRGARQGAGDVPGIGISHRQPASRGRRQPAPVRPVRRAQARRNAARPGNRRRNPETLRGGGRRIVRRTRYRPREARVHAPHVHRRRPGSDGKAQARVRCAHHVRL